MPKKKKGFTPFKKGAKTATAKPGAKKAPPAFLNKKKK